MPELEMLLVDEEAFDDIPDPALPGARCQTCDYWERVDGGRDAPEPGAADAEARASQKRERLLAGRRLAGAYGMLAYQADAVERSAVGYAQFGPISAYPRAQVIRDRYPQLPDSPAPWVITCLQVVAGGQEAAARDRIGMDLLEAVCDELDRRGIVAVEAYPEGVPEPWLPSPGPAEVYEAAGFSRVAGDERYPVYRRELSGTTPEDAWDELLRAGARDEGEGWPTLPPTPDAEDFFRLPPDRPKRPNPFGDD
jgi:hypothetical protein